MTHRLAILIPRFVEGSLTAAERSELMELALDPANRGELEIALDKAWEGLPESALSVEEKEAIWESVIPSGKAKVIPWKRWIAAASIVLAVSLGTWFYLDRQPVATEQLAKTDIEAPATNKARVKLADGSFVDLETAVNGQLALQGNMKLVKLENGQIAYQSDGSEVSSLVYNTLENPAGSKAIDLTLSDGSRVWLNAGSSITYPVTMIADTREVSMTGEAYFEVAKSNKPFLVKKNDITVTVLGTHFNVNAYEDEAAVKVTLLEGSVNVNGTLIKPGQQATVTNSVSVSSDIDTDEVMAWKENRFYFNSADIREIARQLQRWYNVKVEVEPGVSGTFTGVITRASSARDVFGMLNRTGEMKVTIAADKMTIAR